MTQEAKMILYFMDIHHMRLVVPDPTSGLPLRLAADKRLVMQGRVPKEQEVAQDPVRELIAAKPISPLPEFTPKFKPGEGGRLGWRDAPGPEGPGMLENPEGVAEVYACAQ
jgi:hypothetical protein